MQLLLEDVIGPEQTAAIKGKTIILKFETESRRNVLCRH